MQGSGPVEKFKCFLCQVFIVSGVERKGYVLCGVLNVLQCWPLEWLSAVS